MTSGLSLIYKGRYNLDCVYSLIIASNSNRMLVTRACAPVGSSTGYTVQNDGSVYAWATRGMSGLILGLGRYAS
jgi:hypothetical protein